jgi:hypothetical protein
MSKAVIGKKRGPVRAQDARIKLAWVTLIAKNNKKQQTEGDIFFNPVCYDDAHGQAFKEEKSSFNESKKSQGRPWTGTKTLAGVTITKQSAKDDINNYTYPHFNLIACFLRRILERLFRRFGI